jgi:hypothetical protein
MAGMTEKLEDWVGLVDMLKIYVPKMQCSHDHGYEGMATIWESC